MMLLHRNGASPLAVDRWGRSALHEVVRVATDSTMDRVRACLAFLGDLMPLSVASDDVLLIRYGSSGRDTVQRELHLMGRRVRDKVFKHICDCTISVIAELIVQYWEDNEFSLLDCL
jgi:hypothetical protein